MKTEASATPVLYHATAIGKLVETIKNNKFVLTSSIGTDSDDDINEGYLYYFSMTRSRLGHYHSRNTGGGSVLITINGDLLNQKYKTKAVDYWGEEYRKARKGEYEAEDRLLSNKPYIDNAKSYIIDIGVLMPIDETPSNYSMSMLRQCLMLCKKYKIECNVFGNSKDWLTNNKKRAISIDLGSLKHKVIKPRNKFEYLPRDITRTNYYEMNKLKSRSRVRDLLELSEVPKYNQLSKDAKDFIHRMVYDHMQEQFTVLKAAVHNERSNAPEERKNIERLSKILATKKQTLRQFFDSVISKWRPVLLESRE